MRKIQFLLFILFINLGSLSAQNHDLSNITVERTAEQIFDHIIKLGGDISIYFDANNDLKSGFRWLLYASAANFNEELRVSKEIFDSKSFDKELQFVENIDQLLKLYEKYPIRKRWFSEMIEKIEINFIEYINDPDKLIYINGTEIVYTKKSIFKEDMSIAMTKYRFLE